ncbi:MAG TPA: DUF397 domain-containing protein [Pseudonocardiaceae bacterium]|nr:DUF397 domain-containing protein [Pseudonocardiaceae bacterium]
MHDLEQLRWRKPNRSGAGNACVEIAQLPNGDRAIRDSKDPTGPVLTITATTWTAFTATARDDEFH